MFGLSKEAIYNAVKEGKELFVPSSEIAAGNKVQKANAYHFLKNAIMRKRQANPILPNMADIVNWVLYDRITFAAGSTVPQLVRLFVAPIGAGVKTKVDTNLEQVSRLPDPQWFNATGIGIRFNQNIAPVDLAGFLESEYLEFWVGSKWYIEGPLQIFPGATGTFQNISSTVTASTVAASTSTNSANGWPSVHNLYDLRLPGGLPLGRSTDGTQVVADGFTGITILQGQQFYVKLLADGGGYTLIANSAVTPFLGTGITVSAYIHGILSRGAQ